MEESEVIKKQENVNILQAMKDLISVAKDYKIVDELVVKKMTSVKDWILAKATAYGVKDTRYEDVVKICSEKMNEIKTKFEEDRKKILEEKVRLEKVETESATRVVNLKLEIKELKSTDEYKIYSKYIDSKMKEVNKLRAQGREDEANKIVEDLGRYQEDNTILQKVADKTLELKEQKEIYNDSVKSYKENEKARINLINENKKKIAEIAKDQEKSLAKINRKRMLPRFIGKLIDKIGGKEKFEKFADSLISNVSETANKTREFNQNVKEKVTGISGSIRQFIENAKTFNQEMLKAAKESISKIKENQKSKNKEKENVKKQEEQKTEEDRWDVPDFFFADPEDIEK